MPLQYMIRPPVFRLTFLFHYRESVNWICKSITAPFYCQLYFLPAPHWPRDSLQYGVYFLKEKPGCRLPSSMLQFLLRRWDDQAVELLFDSLFLVYVAPAAVNSCSIAACFFFFAHANGVDQLAPALFISAPFANRYFTTSA